MNPPRSIARRALATALLLAGLGSAPLLFAASPVSGSTQSPLLVGYGSGALWEALGAAEAVLAEEDTGRAEALLEQAMAGAEQAPVTEATRQVLIELGIGYVLADTAADWEVLDRMPALVPEGEPALDIAWRLLTEYR